MKLLSELLHYISILSIQGTTDQNVSSIEHDSRICAENALFVAIRGTTQSDGHDYIESAIDNGARSIVCSQFPAFLHSDCTYILVQDTREAAAHLANAFYDFPSQSLRIVGVTGTNGKTTVTYLLKQLLEANGEKIGLIGTTGNMIGNELLPTNYTTPEAPELYRLLARMIDAGITTVVMEVSSHALVLKRVLGIRFAAAIFTNLTHDHLDFHGSMEEYAKAKQMLFTSLDKNSISILNGNSEYAGLMSMESKSTVYLSGGNPNCDLYIDDEVFSMDKTEFTLNGYRYSMPLLGKFNVENIVLCIGVCRAWGMERDKIAHVLDTIKGAPGRMERISLHNGSIAIIDYAHTPDALENTLLALCLMDSSQNLIVIFGCGGNRDTLKRAEMGVIADDYADTIILTNDNPRFEDPDTILNDILHGIEDKQKVIVIPNRAEAITRGLELAEIGNTIVLIAGKGHETCQIIGKEKMFFSDKDEVLKYLCKENNIN
jgi:UDP-N-acetylmuramoyl-L-alanyl-D-glutamate--2,6-diaminopimelate ligase